MLRVIILVFCCFTLSCIHPEKAEVHYQDPPQNDDAYIEVYKKYTAQVEVIKNFETRHIFTATQLSQEFLKSFAQRHEKIFSEPQPVLTEASAKAGFFISGFTANKDLRELNDEQVWNIQLKKAQEVYKPTLVKYLSAKERWKPFFPKVDLWSREYLILFETPQLKDLNLVKAEGWTLVFNSGDSRIEFKW